MEDSFNELRNDMLEIKERSLLNEKKQINEEIQQIDTLLFELEDEGNDKIKKKKTRKKPIR